MLSIPIPRWQELMGQAILCRRAGNYPLAIEKLVQSIELMKTVPGLAKATVDRLNYLADTYLSAGMFSEAEATAREALRQEHQDPNPPAAAFADNMMILAKALHGQGNCRDAVRFGRQALRVYKRYLGWRSDYVRMTKALVASFKKPPAQADTLPRERTRRAS